MISAAHQTMLAPPALPYDAEIEYLESTGTQYIDTGVVPDINTSAEVDAMFSNASSGYTLIGGGVTWSKNEFIITQNPNSGSGAGRVYFNIGTNSNSTVYYQGSNALAGTRHTFGLINRTGYVDGTSKGTWGVSPMVTTNSLFVGAHHRDSSIGEFLVGRVWAVKIWRSSVLVRDFQPVRVGSGSSAVGYLYDRVSGELFGNAGTGAFVIGPDK